MKTTEVNYWSPPTTNYIDWYSIYNVPTTAGYINYNTMNFYF